MKIMNKLLHFHIDSHKTLVCCKIILGIHDTFPECRGLNGNDIHLFKLKIVY